MQKDAAGNPNQGDDVMGELFRPRLTALVGCLPAAEQTTPGAVDCLVTGQAGPSEKHMALRFLPTANGWQLQHSDTEMEVAAPVPDNARVQVLLREDFSKKLVTERNEAVRKSLEQAVSTAQVLAVERCAVSEHAPVVACTVQASAANERGEAVRPGRWAVAERHPRTLTDAAYAPRCSSSDALAITGCVRGMAHTHPDRDVCSISCQCRYASDQHT